MIPILIQPPAVEPVSLPEAKTWLRVDHTADDDLIVALIAAARLSVEAAARKALLAQTWRLALDAWPGFDVLVPLAPLRQVSAVRVYGADNAASVIAPATYVVDPPSNRVRFLSAPRAPGRPFSGCEIDVIVGMASAPDGVPQPLRQAVRMLAARWYERRGDADADARFDSMPGEIAALIAPFRTMRLA
jgi:uncharacterized phiE125 gp8 family phage protein